MTNRFDEIIFSSISILSCCRAIISSWIRIWVSWTRTFSFRTSFSSSSDETSGGWATSRRGCVENVADDNRSAALGRLVESRCVSCWIVAAIAGNFEARSGRFHEKSWCQLTWLRHQPLGCYSLAGKLPRIQLGCSWAKTSATNWTILSSIGRVFILAITVPVRFPVPFLLPEAVAAHFFTRYSPFEAVRNKPTALNGWWTVINCNQRFSY